MLTPNGKRLRCASVPTAETKMSVPRSAVSMPCMPIADRPAALVAKLSPPTSRPTSPASTSSSNLTSECSGWVSSGDTSSSEQKKGKISTEQLRQKLAKIVQPSRKDKTVSFFL